MTTPLPGNPLDANNKPLYQYQDMNDCVSKCSAFDKTHLYGVTASGDSLACRLYHATNAAISVTTGKTHCAHTANTPTGPCSGTAMP